MTSVHQAVWVWLCPCNTLCATAVNTLQELDSSCDVSGLDLQLLEQALLATPPPGAPGSITADAGQSMFASLHLKLQELSIDALAALLDRALGNPSSSHAVTTAGTPAATDAAMATGLAVSQEALACLMANAVLPRLQQLSSAAPKALLSCLTCVGELTTEQAFIRPVNITQLASDG